MSQDEKQTTDQAIQEAAPVEEKIPRKPLTAEEKAIAGQISDQLGETQWGPRRLVEAIVEACGVEFTQMLLAEAMRLEAEGGMLTANGERRRTIGGMFFYLARGRMPDAERRLVFPARNVKAKKKKHKGGGSSIKWADRIAIIQPLLEETGVATTVKVVLIGRPGRIEKRKDLTVTTVTHVNKTSGLPKGVPTPPATPTVYTVYIGAKQWAKVADSIANPEDALIIEGMCAFDKELGAVAVFATSCTTKLLEANKRDRQRAAAGGTDGDESAPPPPRAAAPAIPRPAPTPVNIPASAPAEVAQKLRELHTAADLYRQKIASIESKPGNQQFGLDMTQKLLKNVEDQIKALEAKYT